MLVLFAMIFDVFTVVLLVTLFSQGEAWELASFSLHDFTKFLSPRFPEARDSLTVI